MLAFDLQAASGEVAQEFMSLGHLQLKEDDDKGLDNYRGSFLVPQVPCY